MNKQILFLYTNPSQKSTLLFLEEAIKSVFRKFRKGICVKYRLIDFSASCREAVKKILAEDINSTDGILYYGDTYGETEFFKDSLCAFSVQYFSGNHSIFSPVSLEEAKRTDSVITNTSSTDIADIEKTVFQALDEAKSRNKSVIICTDSHSKSDSLLYDGIENCLANTREYDITHYEFGELIYTFTRSIPQFDAIICSMDKADVIKMHINSLNKFPLAYSILYTDKCRIYKREAVPFEDLSNLSYASLIVAAGNMIEKELGYKSIGQHIKKSARLAIEKCCYTEKAEFQKEVLMQINTPLRNRRVKANESNN